MPANASCRSVTVIIHGWSDCSDSFVDMKRFLSRRGVGDVASIYYGDYQSREDNLTFDDVADGLNDEFRRLGFIDERGRGQREMNIVVHSTGGLVIRHWLWRYYLRDGRRPRDCPVKRIVMLAPANFGSPLAHRGRSFLGSLIKGRWKIGDFLEVGRQLLDGLELASPYQWNLAHRDLLVDEPLFSADDINLTILVGLDDYAGLRGWVNKPGTDGTVVIAGTPVNTLKCVLDCTKPSDQDEEYLPYSWSQKSAVHDVAWGALSGYDHGTIVGALDNAPGELIVRGLTTTSAASFRVLKDDLAAISEQAFASESKPRFQQFIVHAVDDNDNSIGDFTLEFFARAARHVVDARLVSATRMSRDEQVLSDDVSRLMSREFHTHTRDSSYRRFLVDPQAVQQRLRLGKQALGEDVVLAMRVHVPRVDGRITYATGHLQNIVIAGTARSSARQPTFFYPNTTTLLEVRVDRSNQYVKVDTQPRRKR